MLDCCFSGGMTRRDRDIPPDSEQQYYSHRPPSFDPSDQEFWNAVPMAEDGDILNFGDGRTAFRKGSTAEGFRAMYNASHVLLAASSRSLMVKDRQQGALFTKHFIETLEAFEYEVAEVSYKMLFASLPSTCVIHLFYPSILSP